MDTLTTSLIIVGLFSTILIYSLPVKIKRHLFLIGYLIVLFLGPLLDKYQEYWGHYYILVDTLATPFLFYHISGIAGKKLKLEHKLYVFPSVLELFLINYNIDIFKKIDDSPYIALFHIFFDTYISIKCLYILKWKNALKTPSRNKTKKFNLIYYLQSILIVELLYCSFWLLEIGILLFNPRIWNPIPEIIEFLTIVLVFFALKTLIRSIKVSKKRGMRKNMSIPVVHTTDLQPIHEFEKKIRTEKLYLDPDLTLGKLSVLLNTSPKKLSHWISDHKGCNFYHYINNCRVEEFVTLLINPQNKHLNLLGLSQNAGFKNKSTFYKAFKHKYHCTPGQYKKNSILRD